MKFPGLVLNKHDEVLYEIDQILEVWRDHFKSLSTPQDDVHYEREHFLNVTEQVASFNEMSDCGQFLDSPFTITEIEKAISRLHLKKACGDDSITIEHIVCGGKNLKVALMLVFNHVVNFEYVPTNFRVGIQIPLYTGKNLCSLSTDSYRGITLLNNFNKVALGKNGEMVGRDRSYLEVSGCGT